MFIGGGSCFLVGHGFYITALLLLDKISWVGLVAFFAVMAVLTFAYDREKMFLKGSMKIPLALYLGIVALMASVAVGVFVNHPTIGVGLFALGGILFTLSDNILFAYKLGEKSRFLQNILLHAAYYSAQMLIAFGLSCL
jgi:uncharacterized membrane protein YhhN